jgi:flagellar basal body P-ring formation protein FlgA
MKGERAMTCSCRRPANVRRFSRTQRVALPGLLFSALHLVLLVSISPAAEIRLKSQCTAAGPVVKLGDVAEVVGGDHRQSEALSALELFPAPSAAQERFLGVRELQDLLLLRGVNLAEHQFSGSSQVGIAAGNQSAKAAPAQTLSMVIVRRANRRACDAVAKYLETRAAGDGAWTVEAELSEAQARMVADPARAVTIGGGRAPWTGVQRFEVTVQSPQGPMSFPLDARVSVPAAVVLASHSLPRGAVIRADDVELRSEAGGEAGAGAVHSLEEVVGRETTRAVPAGKALSSDALRSPLLVRKGEVVTVYALSAGIRVCTHARARDDGSQGDLVAVESMLDRSTYYARVSGAREVQVYARSPRAEQVAERTEPTKERK